MPVLEVVMTRLLKKAVFFSFEGELVPARSASILRPGLSRAELIFKPIVKTSFFSNFKMKKRGILLHCPWRADHRPVTCPKAAYPLSLV
jgi:hypothetical protein